MLAFRLIWVLLSFVAFEVWIALLAEGASGLEVGAAMALSVSGEKRLFSDSVVHPISLC